MRAQADPPLAPGRMKGPSDPLSPQDLQTLIRTGIPLANFMQLSVLDVRPDGVDLSAPLEPNLNVHGTLFGGSGAAMALVAAWSLAHTRLHSEGCEVPLVVVKQGMQYFKPVRSTVLARARFAQGQGWAPFVQALEQGQRARLGVVVELAPEPHPDEVAARLEATFAAAAAPGDPSRPQGTSGINSHRPRSASQP